MANFPPDMGKMIGEWEADGLDFDNDVLPIVDEIAGKLRHEGRPTPFRARFFDDAIRRAFADDTASLEAAQRARDRVRETEIETGQRAARNGLETLIFVQSFEGLDADNDEKQPTPEFLEAQRTEAARDIARARFLGIDVEVYASSIGIDPTTLPLHAPERLTHEA